MVVEDSGDTVLKREDLWKYPGKGMQDTSKEPSQSGGKSSRELHKSWGIPHPTGNF